MSEASTPKSDKSMSAKVLEGSAWTVSMRLVLRFAGLFNVAILARYLSKEDFGIVAIATSIALFVRMFYYLVAVTPIVRLSNLRDEHYGAALMLRVGFSAVLIAMLFVFRHDIATFYNVPGLNEGLLIVCLTLAIEAFVSPHVSSFQRNMEFSKDFTYIVLGGLVRVGSSISLAIYFQNFYGILWAMTITAAFHLLLSYLMTRGVKLSWDKQAIKDILNLGRWNFVEVLANQLHERADRLILGKFVNTGMLGMFSVAIDIALLPIQLIINPVLRVTLPAMHTLKNKAHSEKQISYQLALGSVIIVALPAALGIGFVAEPLIRTVLGDDWAEAVTIVQAAAGFVFFESLMSILRQMLVVEGRMRVVALFEWVRALLYVAFITLGYRYSGLEGAALAKSTASAIAFFLMMAFVSFRFHIGAKVWGAHLLRALIASAAMFFAMEPIQALSQSLSKMSLVHLMCEAILGGVVYAAALTLVWFVSGKPEGTEERCFAFVSVKRK